MLANNWHLQLQLFAITLQSSSANSLAENVKIRVQVGHLSLPTSIHNLSPSPYLCIQQVNL